MERLYFLDNLKTCIVVLMVVFHAAMSYMAYAPEWWYVLDGDSSLVGTVFVLWADIFIMPVMFFVAGYFALPSLARHGRIGFWRKKGVHIILPWLVGALVCAPYIAYLTIASRPIPMDFPTFYIQLFWGIFYQQAHYWFLGFLCALYGVLFLAICWCPSILQRRCECQPIWKSLVLVLVGSVISMTVVNVYISDDAWIHPFYILVFQPTRVLLYVLYFALGAYAWRGQWFAAFMPWRTCWGCSFLVMSVVYVLFRLGVFGAFMPLETIVVHAVLHNLFCLTAVMALVAWFQAYVAFASPLWRQSAALSYPVYYVHQFAVQHLVWLFRDTGWPLGIKYIAVCILALGISWWFSKIVLKKLPCFS